MSPIIFKSSIRGLLLLACLVFTACGDPNNERTSDPLTGKHPANWILSEHKETVLAKGVEPCFECHGLNGTGGISAVACFGTSGCHIDNAESVHPLSWGKGSVFATNNHGEYLRNNRVDSCVTVYCHGVNWEGVSGQACATCHN
jgi:hypothetical protein